MKKFIAIVFCLSLTSPSFSAIAVDSQEASGAGHRGTTSGTALTWSFTNTAGTKLVCGFICTDGSGGATIKMSTPTYNSVAMTNVSNQRNFSSSPLNNRMAIYYLDSPSTGVNTSSITCNGDGAFATLGGCISFTGVQTGAGTVTSGSGTSGTTATAGSITTATGNYMFANGGWGSGEGGTAQTGFTRTYLTNGSGGTAGDDFLGEYMSSTGTIKNPAFTWSNSDNWGIMAVELIAAASGATVACPAILGSGIICNQQ